MLDDQGLTVFDTLHQMQVNSCQVYKENELFGTYDEASNSFLYMTYEEYNQKVNQCRSLLKDLGKGWKILQYWIDEVVSECVRVLYQFHIENCIMFHAHRLFRCECN